MHTLLRRLNKSIGPIIGSALCFTLSFITLDTLACALDPAFSLTYRHGVGGVVVLLSAVWLACCFASIQPRQLIARLAQHLTWPLSNRWGLFCRYFALGVVLHCAILGLYLGCTSSTWHTVSGAQFLRVVPTLALGLIATLFLAWSEEAVFRGLLLDHCMQYHRFFGSLIISSAVFSLAHDLQAPWRLVSSQWQLGLGLFLLGMFLATLAHRHQTLAASAGFHAGIVFIKVMLRKVPAVTLASSNHLFWPIDLRQSLVVQLLFLGSCWLMWPTKDK